VQDLPLAGQRQIAEGHDDAGHRQGQHRHGIEQAAPPLLAAHHDPGHADAQQQVQQGRKRGVLEAVGDSRQGQAMTQRTGEMRQGQPGGQERGIPVFRQGQQHHAGMRQ